MSDCELVRVGGAPCGQPVTHAWDGVARLCEGGLAPKICDEHAAMLESSEASPLPGFERRTRAAVCAHCRSWTCGPGASTCPQCGQIHDTRRAEGRARLRGVRMNLDADMQHAIAELKQRGGQRS